MRNPDQPAPSGPSIQPGMLDNIRQLFKDARRALLVSHIRPDGDAIGSTLGLGLALRQAGVDAQMALADGVPFSYRHLEGSKQVLRSPGDLSQYDTVIVVDCADLKRTGGLLGTRVPDLNIDHHITNLSFARINFVETEQVATAAIIAEYLPQWGLGYNKAIADALLTGIVTDTIGFRTPNMTPHTLRLAAMLMEHGSNLPDLYTRALVSKTYEAARYWGFGLGKLQQEVIDTGTGDEPARLVWTSLTLSDRQEARYNGNDDADLVNTLSAIEGDAAVIFVEQRHGRVKISWRARPGIDVSKIALQFGGGGHAAASGAELEGTLESIQKQVLSATRIAIAEAVQSKANGEDPNQA